MTRTDTIAHTMVMIAAVATIGVALARPQAAAPAAVVQLEKVVVTAHKADIAPVAALPKVTVVARRIGATEQFAAANRVKQA